MSEQRYGLMVILQHAEEDIVYEAGQPWTAKKKIPVISSGLRAACAVLAVMLGVTGIFHTQVAAAIRQISTYFSEWLGNDRDLSSYTEVLEQTQTSNGVDMTLKEVVMDANRILVSADISSDEQEIQYDRLWVYIGGVLIDGAYLDSLSIAGYGTEDPNRFVMEYSFKESDIPEEISEIELLVYLAETGEDGWNHELANFTFSFAATKEQLQRKTTVLPLDVNMDAEHGMTLYLEEMDNTDVGSRIKADFSSDPRIWYEEGDVRYYDIPYEISVTDDQGNQMIYSVAGSYFDEAELKSVLFDSKGGTPPAEDAEYLEIRLYRYEMPSSEEEPEEDGTGILPELSQQIGEEIRVALK